MTELAKAQLIELDNKFKDKLSGGQTVSVQFNPETLKVTFANALVQDGGKDNAAGNAGTQFVGKGTTKLALTLWFDVTAMIDNPVDDVRKLTQKVIYFMTPKPNGKDKKKLIPAATQFVWGSFLFNGIVEGIEESLEFFAPDGKPLRASLSLTIAQQDILVSKFGDSDNHAKPKTPGQQPMTAAKAGDNLQKIAAKATGDALGWQAIAFANAIEDPLRLAAGSLIDVAKNSFIPVGEALTPNIQAPKSPSGSRLGVN